VKTWVKLYTEINRDPDMGTLSWAHRGIWQALLALCGEIDDRDEEEKETGRLDTLPRVAWSIRCDERELSGAIEAFEERGMVTTSEDGCLWLVNYPKRQARSPSSRPSAIAERVKRHRDKTKADGNEDVTTLHRAVTPSDSDPDPDTDTEGDTDKDIAASAAPPPPAPPESAKGTKGQPYTTGQRGVLERHGAKRYKNRAQADAVLALEQEHGTTRLLEAATWTAKKGMTLGNAIISMESALPGWGNPKKPKGNGDPARASPEPAGYAGIRQWLAEDGDEWPIMQP